MTIFSDISCKIEFTAPETFIDWQGDSTMGVLIFDTKGLHDAWKAHGKTYLEDGDVPRDYTANFVKKVARKIPVGMPLVKVVRDAKDAAVDIHDGRHRTLMLKALQFPEVPAVIEIKDKADFLAMGIAREPTAHELQEIKAREEKSFLSHNKLSV